MENLWRIIPSKCFKVLLSHFDSFSKSSSIDLSDSHVSWDNLQSNMLRGEPVPHRFSSVQHIHTDQASSSKWLKMSFQFPHCLLTPVYANKIRLFTVWCFRKTTLEHEMKRMSRICFFLKENKHDQPRGCLCQCRICLIFPPDNPSEGTAPEMILKVMVTFEK